MRNVELVRAIKPDGLFHGQFSVLPVALSLWIVVQGFDIILVVDAGAAGARHLLHCAAGVIFVELPFRIMPLHTSRLRKCRDRVTSACGRIGTFSDGLAANDALQRLGGKVLLKAGAS